MSALTPLWSWALIVALCSLAVILVVQLCTPYLDDFEHEHTASAAAHAEARRALAAAAGPGRITSWSPRPAAPTAPFDWADLPEVS